MMSRQPRTNSASPLPAGAYIAFRVLCVKLLLNMNVQ